MGSTRLVESFIAQTHLLGMAVQRILGRHVRVGVGVRRGGFYLWRKSMKLEIVNSITNKIRY